MFSKVQIALAAVLVVASASTALADSAKRKAAHRAPATVSEGRNVAVSPISAAEKAWMDRASATSEGAP